MSEFRDRVRIDRQDGIADVRMIRADKMNAMDPAMFAALSEAGDELMQDGSVRVAVLSGEGRAFCAGIDLAAFGAPRDGKRPQRPQRSDSPANFAQRATWVWQEVPVPVIAAIHGVAFGAGFQVAMGADIRFAAPDARLSIREAHWGLVPDAGVTQALRHVVRHDIAKELTFTAREISGEKALEWGLVTHVADDPHAAAMELAREIAALSPSAVRAGKTLWNEALDVGIAEGLALEPKLAATVVGKPNQLEAVRAGMEKRPPKFEDPV